MNSKASHSLFIRLGLTCLSLVTIGWLTWPGPVKAGDPIFSDV